MTTKTRPEIEPIDHLDFTPACEHRFAGDPPVSCQNKADFIQVRQCDHSSYLCKSCVAGGMTSTRGFICLLCNTRWNTFGAATKKLLPI